VPMEFPEPEEESGAVRDPKAVKQEDVDAALELSYTRHGDETKQEKTGERVAATRRVELPVPIDLTGTKPVLLDSLNLREFRTKERNRSVISKD